MPPAAVPVTLTASQRKTLKERVRGAKTCWRDRLRAQVVLAAARNCPNARTVPVVVAACLRYALGHLPALSPSSTEVSPPGKARCLLQSVFVYLRHERDA
jgi:hypothetical protein